MRLKLILKLVSLASVLFCLLCQPLSAQSNWRMIYEKGIFLLNRNDTVGKELKFVESKSPGLSAMLFYHDTSSILKTIQLGANVTTLDLQGVLWFDERNLMVSDYGYGAVTLMNFDGEVIHEIVGDYLKESYIEAIGDSGCFVVSNWWEFSGTQIEIYNSNFKLVESIKPFEGGFFENFLTIEDGNQTAIWVSDKNKSKLILFSNKTGKLKKTYDLPLSGNYYTIRLNQEKLVFYKPYKPLICVDLKTQKIVWEFSNASLSGFSMKTFDNKLAVVSPKSNQLNVLDLESGELIWETILSENLPSQPMEKLPSEIEILDDENILLVFENYQKETSSIHYQLIIASRNGEIAQLSFTKDLGVNIQFQKNRIIMTQAMPYEVKYYHLEE